MPIRSFEESFQSSTPWDDPVGTAVADPILGPHDVERHIWRELQQASGGQFSSLTVRRMPDGVCLQGVLETENNEFLDDVDDLVKRIASVERVLNQLVVREFRAS